MGFTHIIVTVIYYHLNSATLIQQTTAKLFIDNHQKWF